MHSQEITDEMNDRDRKRAVMIREVADLVREYHSGDRVVDDGVQRYLRGRAEYFDMLSDLNYSESGDAVETRA